MIEDKKKAEKAPPLSFDELNNHLILAIVQIDQQQSDLQSLAERVSELERRSGFFK